MHKFSLWQLDQPDFGMPGRKYYLNGLNDPMVQAYKELAQSVARAFEGDPGTVERDMEDVVKLEIDLANVWKLYMLQSITQRNIPLTLNLRLDILSFSVIYLDIQ